MRWQTRQPRRASAEAHGATPGRRLLPCARYGLARRLPRLGAQQQPQHGGHSCGHLRCRTSPSAAEMRAGPLGPPAESQGAETTTQPQRVTLRSRTWQHPQQEGGHGRKPRQAAREQRVLRRVGWDSSRSAKLHSRVPTTCAWFRHGSSLRLDWRHRTPGDPRQGRGGRRRAPVGARVRQVQSEAQNR